MTWNTLEEERREVWISVLEALRGARMDRDQEAACRKLLRHLVQSARPAGATD